MVICFMLETQVIARAFSRAWANTGKRIAARIAIIAMTTSSSISVKPRELRRERMVSPIRCVPVVLESRASGISTSKFRGDGLRETYRTPAPTLNRRDKEREPDERD